MKGNLDNAASGSVPDAKAKAPRPGELRVWWIPQVPGKPFHVAVSSSAEAQKIMDVLASYDLFQFENRIKPDYSSAGGLSVFEDGDWFDWEDENGNDIDHTEGGRLWEPEAK